MPELLADMVAAARSSPFPREALIATDMNIKVMTIAAISALISFKQSSHNSRFIEAQIFCVDFQ